MSFSNEILTIAGAPLLGESPLPKFRSRTPTVPKILNEFPKALSETAGFHQKVLPYTMQDRYDRRRTQMKLKCFVLENEFLRAEFLPEYGGRLHSLYDKVLKTDLLFTNTVIQPCNLAIRDAWLSGGIEWNIGCIGHTFTTCDNVFCAKLEDGEGNTFIRIYEFERLKSIFWQVDFHLPKGSRQLITHVRLVNPFPVDTTVYWWTNVAVPDNGKTRILASGKKVISFIDGDMMYETLPTLEAMPGDVSYPRTATRSFDFFITPNYPDECTWEAAAYDTGTVFYERSTAPLSYKKLYVWGAHRAGDHWQEFLSEPGKGYYAEIQAGIAPSQLHDMLFPANTTYEWTQVFGGVNTDKGSIYHESYDFAVDYFDSVVNTCISDADIRALDKKLAALADIPVTVDKIIHTGSGFGAIEAKRIEKDGDGYVPVTMCFPEFTIGKKEYPWLCLVETGKLPIEDARYVTPTFMTSEKWLSRIKADADRADNWYALYQYGIAIYDGVDGTKIATAAYSDEDRDARAALAEKMWLKSLEICPSYFTYRNLGVLETQRENYEKAAEYYALAMKFDGAFDDYALFNEYIELLCSMGRYEEAWCAYEKAPEQIRTEDRVRISLSIAAAKLDKEAYLSEFFAQQHHKIREGENTVTDAWFEHCARKMAHERGIEITPESIEPLLDEAWETCEPDAMHDFRQSYNRNQKYRV